MIDLVIIVIARKLMKMKPMIMMMIILTGCLGYSEDYHKVRASWMGFFRGK